MSTFILKIKWKHTFDCDGLTLFGFFGWVGARTVVSSIALTSDVHDLIWFFKLPGSLGSKAALSVNMVPSELDGKRTTLYRANQRDVLPLRNVPCAGNDVQHWLRHRLCMEKTRWIKTTSNLSECAWNHCCIRRTYNVGWLQQLPCFCHGNPAPIVFRVAKNVVYIDSLVDGWGVKDGFLPLFAHHPGLRLPVRAI